MYEFPTSSSTQCLGGVWAHPEGARESTHDHHPLCHIFHFFFLVKFRGDALSKKDTKQRQAGHHTTIKGVRSTGLRFGAGVVCFVLWTSRPTLQHPSVSTVVGGSE
jgi:hypothetical protein